MEFHYGNFKMQGEGTPFILQFQGLLVSCSQTVERYWEQIIMRSSCVLLIDNQYSRLSYLMPSFFFLF